MQYSTDFFVLFMHFSICSLHTKKRKRKKTERKLKVSNRTRRKPHHQRKGNWMKCNFTLVNAIKERKQEKKKSENKCSGTFFESAFTHKMATFVLFQRKIMHSSEIASYDIRNSENNRISRRKCCFHPIRSRLIFIFQKQQIQYVECNVQWKHLDDCKWQRTYPWWSWIIKTTILICIANDENELRYVNELRMINNFKYIRCVRVYAVHQLRKPISFHSFSHCNHPVLAPKTFYRKFKSDVLFRLCLWIRLFRLSFL